MVPVSYRIIHPDYDDNNHDNDAALVYLRSALTINGGSIRSVKLIAPNTVLYEGQQVTVTGWGYLRVSTHFCNLI